mmetsp:Transcript_22967/g.52643  ORF Transcript_22967/g.52643 Transcript_22967/m.52643 type:complete len:255 (-) Transcript_22967:961-1725(-)
MCTSGTVAHARIDTFLSPLWTLHTLISFRSTHTSQPAVDSEACCKSRPNSLAVIAILCLTFTSKSMKSCQPLKKGFSGFLPFSGTLQPSLMLTSSASRRSIWLSALRTSSQMRSEACCASKSRASPGCRQRKGDSLWELGDFVRVAMRPVRRSMQGLKLCHFDGALCLPKASAYTMHSITLVSTSVGYAFACSMTSLIELCDSNAFICSTNAHSCSPSARGQTRYMTESVWKTNKLFMNCPLLSVLHSSSNESM